MLIFSNESVKSIEVLNITFMVKSIEVLNSLYYLFGQVLDVMVIVLPEIKYL